MSRLMLRRATLFIAAAVLSTWATAQKAPKESTAAAPWPTKTVRIIVGFPAGSSPDLTARIFAEPLAKALGQAVIVENKVGAGGNIAADYVAKATDDHTIGLMINGNMTIAKLLNPKLNYDPLKDLTPVSLIGVSPLVLTAPVDSPGANAKEFLAAARSAGDKWSAGAAQHAGSGCEGLQPGNLERDCRTELAAETGGGQIVGPVQRHRPHARHASKAVSAGLAGGGDVG
jgi:tripartite-type tricarboxylate transporter receptor subunit TctC